MGLKSPQRRASRQWGGTFLGLVLGLIVGLAIAVVVALYITKAPTPFVEKTPPRPEDNSPAAQVPNPNQALQSNVPPAVASAAAGVASAPAAATQSPAAPAAPVQPAQPAPNNQQATGQGVPTGKPSPADILNGRTEGSAPVPGVAPTHAPVAPATTQAATDDSKTGYFLQIGAYKSASDAEQQRANLVLQGFDAKVTQRDANGLTLYRVRLGPYSKFDEMNRARQRLADAGVETAVIRFTKQ